jgi:hypothetical protein
MTNCCLLYAWIASVTSLIEALCLLKNETNIPLAKYIWNVSSLAPVIHSKPESFDDLYQKWFAAFPRTSR